MEMKIEQQRERFWCVQVLIKRKKIEREDGGDFAIKKQSPWAPLLVKLYSSRCSLFIMESTLR